jgi:hypothetical protein
VDEDEEFRVGIIGRIRRDFGLRLKIVSYAVWIAISVIVAATVVTSVLVWQSTAILADRLAGISVIFAGMTLLLAVFAAVVAYLAFSVSIGLPDLKLQVRFGPSPPNRLSVTAEPKNGRLNATDPAQTEVAICFRNDGNYAAKAPAVIVQLEGMEFEADVRYLNASWTVNERSETGIRVVQWEGDATNSVYTNMVRELPVLNLTGLRTIPDWKGNWEGPVPRREPPEPDETPYPFIVISISTDIGRRVAWLPVDFEVGGESQFPPGKKLPEWF